jgi:hypothetical protein
MKKLTILTLLLLVVFSAWSQQATVPVDALLQLDPSKADLSNASVYFDTPVEFYISGVEYMGDSYAAIVKVTEDQTVEIYAPSDAELTLMDRVGMSIDVSKMSITVPTTLNGVITLSGVVVDGYEASLDVAVDVEASKALGTVVLAPVTMPELSLADNNPAVIAELLADREATIAAKSKDLITKIKEVDELKAQNSELQAMYNELLAMMGADMSAEGASTLFVDLSTLQTFGAWKETATGIDMTDKGALVAKVAAQISQAKTELFYKFTVDGNSSQKWIGAGAHILGDGVKLLGGYGFGKSYLVWLTKDARLQTDTTFVQLYESSSDSKMIQLASEAIVGDINSKNDVSIYVNKDTDVISVSVNGVEYISYESQKDLPNGQIAALRAAGGPVSFSDLSVKAR